MNVFLFVLALALSTQVVAFFPTTALERFFGHSGISHELITQATYSSLIAKYFPEFHPLSNEAWDMVSPLPDGAHTSSMVEASRTLVNANIEVDLDPCDSARHSDGENLVGARDIIISAKSKVIRQVKAGNGTAALAILGDALHPLQDFYAHSNYVELGNTKPFLNMHTENMTLDLAAPEESTCEACSTAPTLWSCQERDCLNNTSGFRKLTSGYNYFENSPSDQLSYDDGKCHSTTRKIPARKCHHGGPFDKDKSALSAALETLLWGPQEGINKDSFTCTLSPHYQLHFKAAKLAWQASVHYVDHIIEEGKFTDRDKRILLGINGGVLAVVFDTNTNDHKMLNETKNQIISIARARIGTKDEPLSYIVTQMIDGESKTLETSSFDRFFTYINQIKSQGLNNQCSKPVYTGIIDALNRVKGPGSLLALTDSDAKDGHLKVTAEALAAQHSIQIHLINHAGECNRIRTLNEEQGSSTLLNSNLATLASSTGGASFSFAKADRSSYSNLLNGLAQVAPPIILSVSGELATDNPLSYELPLDTQLEYISLFLTGFDSNVALFWPNGTLYTDTFDSELPTSSSLKSIKVDSIISGKWRAVVSGNGPFQLRVQGSSLLRLKTFDFVETKGRPGHHGYYKMQGNPDPHRDVTIFAKIIGGFSQAKFSFREADGTHIIDIPLQSGSGEMGDLPQNHFVGKMKLPARNLNVYVTGNDEMGAPFQRVFPKTFYTTRLNSFQSRLKTQIIS